jgi:hypothetical protein
MATILSVFGLPLIGATFAGQLDVSEFRPLQRVLVCARSVRDIKNMWKNIWLYR